MQQSNGDYKIGYSVDVEKRLRELQTGNSDSLRIKFIIPDSTISFEQYIHTLCSRYHIQGEWFKEEVVDFLLSGSPWFKNNMQRYGGKV